MINVSNNFKKALTMPKMIDAKITYNDVKQTGDNDLNVISRIFDAGLFKTCMKGLNIDTNTLIPKNTMINAYFGVFVNNDFEYANLGNYKTHEPVRNEDNNAYTIESYDKIEESMIDYDLNVGYPIQVKDLFVKIYDRLGWDKSGIPETFTNSNKLIKKDLWSGMKYKFRDCLDELCTITCQWLIDKNGIPTLTQPIQTNQSLDEEYFSEDNVSIKERVFFNSLIFSRIEDADMIDRRDEESIKANGLHAFVVKDNQLLSTNDRVDFIDEMWEYIKNFTYYSFDCKTIGIVFLEPIDKFTISLNGIDYETLLLADDLQITSDTEEQIYSDKPVEEERELKYSSQTDKAKNQSFIINDKQNQKIQALTKTVNDEQEKVAQLSIDSDSISQSVATITNTLIPDINNNLESYKEQVSTQFTQVSDEFNMKFIQEYLPLINDLQDDNKDNSETLNKIEKYIRFVSGNIILGEENSVFRLEIKGGVDGEIAFMQGNNKLAYFNKNQLYIPVVTVFERLQVGKTDTDNYYWDIDSEGNLNLNYGGDE